MSETTCPVCEQGALTPCTGTIHIRYSGPHGRGVVDVPGCEWMKCDSCDAKPVLPDQIARNDERIARACEGHFDSEVSHGGHTPPQ